MWAMMAKLAEYNELATALDTAVEAKVAALEAAGRSEDANGLRSDALFPIRQRRQDIMTQMAVAVQGYMALDLVRKNNIELIKGLTARRPPPSRHCVPRSSWRRRWPGRSSCSTRSRP